MKYFIFLFSFILSFLLLTSSYADFSHFYFSLNSYLVRNSKDIKVDFEYILSGYEEKAFLVRPVMENGLVEIFEKDSGKWISSYDYLFNLPSIEKEMRIRINGLEAEKSSLYFEIFNTETGETYETPKKNIWTERIYKDYLNDVRVNLLKIKSLRELYEENIESTQSIGSIESVDSVIFENKKRREIEEAFENIPRKYFLFLGLGIFILSLALGLKRGLKIREDKKPVDGKIH